ncbi:hypothetical protein Pst134EB_016536 [Puccinia striiformis f. sp. tritici]|nr:hypothetical protein Pst134EB_016536 [Puccinia striiformis f. sp. tritici]
MVWPERADKYFPVLELITEVQLEELVKEDIVVVDDEINDVEPKVDPDDAEPATPEPGWEWNLENDEDGEEGEVTGIAFTLKWNPRHKSKWNITFESWERAYEGRKVIKQLLENENDKHTGQSSEGHHFKGYELSLREWEDVIDLNQVLKEFLEMTKQMEGDGPKLAMVLYEYVRTQDFLGRKMEAAAATVLEPMFNPMIRVTQKYLDLALKCDTVVITTFLHPAWRMMLFNYRFSTHVTRISELIQLKFNDRESHLKSLQPESPPVKDLPSNSNKDDDSNSNSCGEEFNFYPKENEVVDINTELERYNSGVFPIKGCVLGWWKTNGWALRRSTKKGLTAEGLVRSIFCFEEKEVQTLMGLK